MINKDDELLIIGIINEDTIEGNIPLKEVRSVFFDLIQVGPMFRTFIQKLEEKRGGVITDERIAVIDLPYSEVFSILKSPEYLRDVPKVSYNFYESLSSFMLTQLLPICIVFERQRHMGQRDASGPLADFAALPVHHGRRGEARRRCIQLASQRQREEDCLLGLELRNHPKGSQSK